MPVGQLTAQRQLVAAMLLRQSRTLSGDRVERASLRAYVCFMILAKIDRWIGLNLFIPPIIKLCQVTRQTQFAVSRLFWFLAALDAFYRAETLVWSILWGAICIVMLISAGRRADSPTASFMFLRMLALALLVIDLLAGLVTSEWSGVEIWLLVLIAEYAATIRTLPPTEPSREKRATEASAGQ